MKEREINPNVRKRLEFIEFSLFWKGKIGRKNIREQFHISLQQATIDLNSYLEIAPMNMFYNPRVKRYVPHESFKPIFINGSAEEYFQFLDAYVQGYRSEKEIWIPFIPDFNRVSTPQRNVDASVLREVLNAIEMSQSFQMRYTSLHSTAGTVKPRRVSPHAFGADGNRWHMRAYDHDNKQFADFVLSRIKDPKDVQASEVKPADDKGWNTELTVCLIPDAELPAPKRQSIAEEYNMINSVLELNVSQAMLFYHLRQFGFNPVPGKNKKMRNESSYQLQIQNFDETEEWLQRR